MNEDKKSQLTKTFSRRMRSVMCDKDMTGVQLADEADIAASLISTVAHN